MQAHRFLFSLVAASLFTAALTTASRADAQSIGVVSEQSLPRLDSHGQLVTKRALSLNPEGINAQDCRDDQRIRFPVLLDQFQANATVQIWAAPRGVDCAISGNRSNMDAQCWPLVTGVPLQQTIDVDIPVRSIVPPGADGSVCGAVDLTEIDVQIMMFEPGNLQTPSVSKTVRIAVDTLAPQAPELAKISPGNGRARVEIGNAPAPFVELTAFCERSASTDSCAASSLSPGKESDPTRACGTVAGANASTLFAGPLENGTTNAVAIAARDSFGNLGPLSNVGCAIPSADAEPAAGSDDGGCAIGRSHGGRAGGAYAAAVLLLGLCLAFAGRKAGARRT